MPAQTAEFFRLFAEMALHLVQRFGRVHDRETAALLHLLDLLEQLDEFVLREIHQPAVAEAEVAARQRRERIAERATLEAKRFEKRRQLVVIVNQPARRDARRGLNARAVEKLVRVFDLPAHVRQAAILLVLRDVVRVNGHDHAAQTIVRQAAQVGFGPEAAVGADHRMHAALRRVARHGAQFLVNHRFAADEQQVADVILHRDVHHVLRFLERHTAACFRIKLRARETAKVAIRVADVGDGELEITRPAMFEHFADQFEHALLRFHDGLGKIHRDRRGPIGFGGARFEGCRREAHDNSQDCVQTRRSGQTFF